MTERRQSDDVGRPADRLAGLNEPFQKMFCAEIDGWVKHLPKYNGKANISPLPDTQNNLVGIAMSGGGMRSATYNLGVAQALASTKGLLDQVDYMSTVSGGGYFGSSLTALCCEELPYSNSSAATQSRLGMDPDDFPYAFPRPLRDPDEKTGPVNIHDLESPATRHLREYSNLLASSLGLFDVEMWTALARYLFNTAALWCLFLLPPVTAIFLLSILIPDSVWMRADPLSAGGSQSWLASSAWILTAPLWFLAAVAALTILFRNVEFRLLKRVLLTLMVISAVAVILLLGLWAITLALANAQSLTELMMVIIGGGSAGVTGIAGRKMMMPASVHQSLWKALFSVSGYLVLGLGLLVWHYYLMTWLTSGRLEVPLLDPASTNWPGYLIAWLGVALALVIAMILGTRLLNHLSLHDLYLRRLRRTWIISAKAHGTPGPASTSSTHQAPPSKSWTRVYSRPDINMHYLRTQTEKIKPATPYQLICTTLNIPGSTSPKLLDRKADSFVIAPIYSGSALSRWAHNTCPEMSELDQMTLERAATISAAAVSPNMGWATSRTLSILTTLLNVRLGWWTPNPRVPVSWHKWIPGYLSYWLEMFGLASHEHRKVYLSDGGHFDNTGLHELFRRRCRYIIAVDGTGEPPDPANDVLYFSGLGQAIRLARIDFGVEVNIDLRPLMRRSESGEVGYHFAVGRIRYPTPLEGNDSSGGDRHGTGVPSSDHSGILLYIKLGRVFRDFTTDMLNYIRQVNPDFPHDTTADQQFDQAQFESYRQLGYLAGRSVINSFGEYTELKERFEELDRRYQILLKTDFASS